MLAWGVSGCLDGGAGGPHDDPCFVGAARDGLFAADTASTTIVAGDPQLSIVAVLPSFDGAPSLCTGTVVAPSWVLTAGHCAGEGAVAFGDLDQPLFEARISFATRHPTLDVGLLRVPGDINGRMGPIPISTELPAGAREGLVVELAGRGLTETGKFGQLRFLLEPISMVSSNMIEVDGAGRSGACLGDSGGPLLVLDAEGRTAVAGTLSTGAANCVGKDRYVRADRFATWVDAVIARYAVSLCDPLVQAGTG